jgi:hypothetical protein
MIEPRDIVDVIDTVAAPGLLLFLLAGLALAAAVECRGRPRR